MTPARRGRSQRPVRPGRPAEVSPARPTRSRGYPARRSVCASVATSFQWGIGRIPAHSLQWGVGRIPAHSLQWGVGHSISMGISADGYDVGTVKKGV
jgi:hypothetical protein